MHPASMPQQMKTNVMVKSIWDGKAYFMVGIGYYCGTAICSGHYSYLSYKYDLHC